MSSHNTNQSKEILYIKIKSLNESNKPLIKKSILHSYLSDYNKISAQVKNAIITLEKGIKLEEYKTILILNHPILTNVYIYSKEQWQLYYNYNIIDQCINNKILKMNFDLVNKDDNLKIFRKNKKKVIKYIIQNISIKLFSKIFFKFLKENGNLTKKFECFFIQELLNEKPEKNKNKKNNIDNNLDDLDMNLNINNIISNEETEESSGDILEHSTKKEKLFPKLDEEYLLHSIDFLKSLESQFKTFSEKIENLNKIKEITGEESESDKIEDEKDMGLKTSLKLNLEESISNLSLFEEDVVENNEKENNVLLTQMNPPPSYVKKLLNDDNFFKQFDKEEYYMGIEKFKDEINRQFLRYNSKALE